MTEAETFVIIDSSGKDNKENLKKMRRKKRHSLGFWQYFGLAFLGVLLYLWQHGLSFNFSAQIPGLESRYKDLQAENRQLQVQSIALKNAAAIRERVARFNLPLVEPDGWNVYRIETAGRGRAETRTDTAPDRAGEKPAPPVRIRPTL